MLPTGHIFLPNLPRLQKPGLNKSPIPKPKIHFLNYQREHDFGSELVIKRQDRKIVLHFFLENGQKALSWHLYYFLVMAYLLIEVKVDETILVKYHQLWVF